MLYKNKIIIIIINNFKIFSKKIKKTIYTIIVNIP